jgi:CO/xanthine dehydrogenase Mo-binding subunit
MSATTPIVTKAAAKESQPAQNPALAPEALAALHQAGFSRRAFLKGAGALIVTFSATSVVGTAFGQGRGRGGAVDPTVPNPQQLDSWLAINADGAVTAYTGKVELGQGISTAQIQLVAEELSVPFERVTLIYGDTAMTPDQGVTSGSQSHPTNFNNGALALAGATARQALLRMGSQRLGVPVEQLAAANGVISVKSDPSRQVTYGQLVAGRKFEMTLDRQAKRKPHAEWTVLGKPARRPDLPAMVTGQFEFVHNVRLPGMLHGRVVRPPAVGATVVSVDQASVASVPGLVKVVVKKDFVGVVARKPWQAIQAANQLKVNWSPGTGLPSFAGYYDYLRNQKPTRDTLYVDSKDIEQELASGTGIVEATYLHPFQMHGSLGSSCAVADVRGDRATIYSPTQGAWNQRSSSAMVLGLQPQNVRVIFRRGSGCYGCNGADAVTFDAAILSQAVQAPVRVQYSRKDEHAWGENYGLPFVMDERAALDAQGNIIAWDHEAWSAVLGGRPGNAQPGNVISGTLAGFEPAAFAPRSPAPDPQQFDNGNNSVPSYCAGAVGGQARGTGTIKSERSLLHNVRSPFYTAPLRSPARLQNTFAHESFMDELAARAKADPVSFRLRHLSDPRLRDVVTEGAKAFKWDARPSPRAGIRKAGMATGRGMSCVLYEGDNGYAAMFCEVEVNQATGAITVKRMVISNDSGPISNPDGLKNQMEGGALQGLSRALGEEVTWDAQQITSVDWRSYRSLPVGFSVPTIDVVLLDRPEHPAMGAGETSITLTASAVGNAVFDATGARLRQVPFTPENVKAALAQRP